MRIDRPMAFGLNPNSATAASTRAMASTLTGPERLMTRETVDNEQPASFATCLIVVVWMVSAEAMEQC